MHVGFDLGGSKLAGVLTDDKGSVLASHVTATPAHGRWVVSALLDMVDDLCQSANAEIDTVEFVGLGIAALVAPDGSIHGSTHLGGLRGLDLRQSLADAGRWKVEVDNDANCAARAGIGGSSDNFGFIGIGTGIGGAIVRDSRVERGAHGFAGEIGHMIVVAGGEQCPCGKRGCLEAYASGRALRRMVERAFVKGRLPELVDVTAPQRPPLTQAIFEGTKDCAGAAEIIREFAFYLAVGISNLVELYDLDKVLLGGGVSDSFALFSEDLRTQYDAVMVSPRKVAPVEIAAVPFGSLAGAVGAARMAADF